ncbi:glycosyl hydrolase family 18 protein [Streptomyces sp. NPDC051018]|uniref:glycosyl hydrolase family 18 protein n=1 Tax=Streptomyces sp. NPDC051018 TaxID=3365639 RepID=UPI00379C274A
MKTRTAPFTRTTAFAAVCVLALLLGLTAAVATPARAQQNNYPTGLRAVAVGDTTVSLRWDPAARPAEVGHYQVVVDGGFEVGTTTGTTFTVTHLNVDTAYTFAVIAISPDGREGWSSVHIPVRTTGTVPPMPAHPVRMGIFTEKGSHEREFYVKNLMTSGTAARLTHLTYGYGRVTGGRCGIADTYAALERAYPAETSVDGKADTWDQPLRGYLHQLRELKQARPGLRILWSFGGFEQARDWTGAQQDPAAFAASCARLIDDPRWAGLFDGIDLDMEIPECRLAPCDLGGAAAVKPLTRALRAALGPDRLVTVTIGHRGGGADLYGRTDLTGAAAHTDWFNVRTYDYYQSTHPLQRNRPTPHAPLYSWNTDDWGRAVHHDIRGLTAQGVHPNKLVLGVPTHAWGWEGVRAKPWVGHYYATGPASGPYELGLDDYRSIRSRCADTGELGQTAYSHCGSQFWGYDTPATVKKKMDYARQYGLGGAYLSNLRGDTANGDLSAAVERSLGPVR